MKEFGNVRFIARHGRISDAHGERQSIDFCGIVLQRLLLGKTVDVKLDTFAHEVATVDVIEEWLRKYLQIVGRMSPLDLSDHFDDGQVNSLRHCTNRDEIHAMMVKFFVTRMISLSGHRGVPSV